MNPHQKPQEDVVGNAAKFMRHDGLCAIIGGYGFCSCGRDVAYDALIAAPTYEAGRRDMREAADEPLDYIDLFRIIRRAGRKDAAKAKAVYDAYTGAIRNLTTEPLGGGHP